MESLAFYDPVTVTSPAAFALAAAAPGSSDDIQLRVLNTSELYQAEDVTVTVSGADSGELWLSLDGDVFTASIAVGDIPPGAACALFYLRRVTASTAGFGSRTAQLSAVPASWSNPADTSISDNVPLETGD